MNKLTRLLIALIALSPGLLFAQQNEFVPTIDQMVTSPTSPEAAAFSKYGGTDISHYSGTPNISIPLTVLKGRSFNLPITLTYDASGVKVDQVASWVGLGWNLNAGGVVTRQAKGLPDDWTSSTPTYYPHYSEEVYSTIGTNTIKYYNDYFLVNDMFVGNHAAGLPMAYAQFMKAYGLREIDTQPDTYSFSVNGLSGEFFIDYDTGKGVSVNNPQLDITPDLDTALGTLGGSRVIDGFTIKDQMGNSYLFDKVESTEQMDGDPSDSRIYNSAWYLTKITTANSRDVIDFNYTTAAWWTNDQNLGDITIQKASGAAPTSLCGGYEGSQLNENTEYNIKQFDMTSIVVNGKTMASFTRSARTTDLPGKNKLDKISISQSNSESADMIKFNYSHFVTGNGSTQFKNRLKLDGISFWGAGSGGENDADNRKDYDFDYFTGELPERGVKAQDFWGYYNGNDGSTSLIPADLTFDDVLFTGKDRKSNFVNSLKGTLQQITYPTGGTSEFFYQPNFLDTNDPWNVGGASATQTVIYGMAYVDGFEDTNDPAGFSTCNNLDNTSEYPAQSLSTMSVSEAGDYDLEINVTNDPSSIQSEVAYVVIYKGTTNVLCDFVTTPLATSLYYKDNFSPGTGTQTITQTITLEAKSIYTIMVVSNSDIIDLKVTRDEQVEGTGFGGGSTNREMGSFRIYKTEDKATTAAAAQTKYFYYGDLSTVSQSTTFDDNFFKNSTVSSGVLQVPVNFITRSDMHFQNPTNENLYSECELYNRLSNNTYRQHGGIMTYSTVSEVVWDSNSLNGFTVHEFYNASETTQNQTTKSNYKNGKPLKQRVYDDQFDKIQQTDYEYVQVGLEGSAGISFISEKFAYYNIEDPSIHSTGRVEYIEMELLGMPGDIKPHGCTGSKCLESGPVNLYAQANYGLGEYWLQQKSQTTTNYDGTDPVVVVNENFYESSDHFEVTKTEMTDSNGDDYKTEFFYPVDLPDSYMSDLETAHRTGEVIQTTKYKGTTKLSDQKTKYLKTGTKVYPEILQYAIGTTTLESRITYNEYDSDGNPLSLTKDGVTSLAFIWGHNTSLPIAQVTNADDNDVIAFASFENGEGSNWTYAGGATASTSLPSGTRYYSLSGGALSMSGLTSSQKYIVTYWAKDGTPTIAGGTVTSDDAAAANGAGWKFYNKEITGTTSVTISGTAKIDEVRLYPKGSQMTSYTYKPGWGLTTQTGSNGTAMHYEYDIYGRLVKVFDQDWNILQLKDYKYKEIISNPNN